MWNKRASLRSKLIRLAYVQPGLRPVLLQILKEAQKKDHQSVGKYWLRQFDDESGRRIEKIEDLIYDVEDTDKDLAQDLSELRDKVKGMAAPLREKIKSYRDTGEPSHDEINKEWKNFTSDSRDVGTKAEKAVKNPKLHKKKKEYERKRKEEKEKLSPQQEKELKKKKVPNPDRGEPGAPKEISLNTLEKKDKSMFDKWWDKLTGKKALGPLARHTIRLAYERPDLRQHLLPLLKEGSGMSDLLLEVSEMVAPHQELFMRLWEQGNKRGIKKLLERRFGPMIHWHPTVRQFWSLM